MRFALLALLVPSVALADVAGDAAELVRAMKRHDAKAIAAKLSTPFTYNGAWFPDAACAKRFARAGVLQTKDRDAFARCFAKLVPQLSTRTSMAPSGVVITVEPGIELEVTFADGLVRWLGPAGAMDKSDERRTRSSAEGDAKVIDKSLPMLTAQVFEQLRTHGTTLLDDAVRTELELELVKANPTSAWIRTCLDVTGKTTREVAWSSTPKTGEVFLRATSDWKFRPFVHRKVATPACSLTLLTYPASKAPSVEQLPGLSGPLLSYGLDVDLDVFMPPQLPSIATIQAAELEALAITPLDPKPATVHQVLSTAPDRLSDINVCITAKGDVKNVVTMERNPGDRTRAAKLWRWPRFKPHVRNGVAVEACALLQFVVTP